MVDNLVVHELFAKSDHYITTFDLFCDLSMTYWNKIYNDFR